MIKLLQLSDDKKQKVIKRLESRRRIIDDTGCWESTYSGPKYANTSIQGIHYNVHRAAFVLYYNIDVTNALVMHKCDNPKCFNPEHLQLGDDKQNNKDSITRGRKNAKDWMSLSVDEIRMLKFELAGTSVDERAELFNITRTFIHKVDSGALMEWVLEDGISEDVTEMITKWQHGATKKELATAGGVPISVVDMWLLGCTRPARMEVPSHIRTVIYTNHFTDEKIMEVFNITQEMIDDVRA